jgi:hypothetical protein
MEDVKKEEIKKEEIKKSAILRGSEWLTIWIGSPQSIVVHSIFFVGMFTLALFRVPMELILLILTTAVSLEAIYMNIFIQMTVNMHTQRLQGVGEDIEELGEEVEDIGEDLEELGEDIEEISGDIDKIQEDETQEEKEEQETRDSLDNIESTLQKLLLDIEALKKDARK